jgi:hypothetical protein
VEKPYEEVSHSLKDVCEDFWRCGVSFAADDFGVKSQSHQVVLELGIMIKEFKLDPISFRFKANEDQIKFLDNLAFIDYCKRLADNREAMITAEAVEDYDSLQFLMEHQIYQYQSNIFCGKMPIDQYKAEFESMSELPQALAQEIINERAPEMWKDHSSNIFEVAREKGHRGRHPSLNPTDRSDPAEITIGCRRSCSPGSGAGFRRTHFLDIYALMGSCPGSPHLQGPAGEIA